MEKNNRYKHFNQDYFTAGDEEQFTSRRNRKNSKGYVLYFYDYTYGKTKFFVTVENFKENYEVLE